MVLLSCVAFLVLFACLLNLGAAGYPPYLPPSLCNRYLSHAVMERLKGKDRSKRGSIPR